MIRLINSLSLKKKKFPSKPFAFYFVTILWTIISKSNGKDNLSEQISVTKKLNKNYVNKRLNDGLKSHIFYSCSHKNETSISKTGSHFISSNKFDYRHIEMYEYVQYKLNESQRRKMSYPIWSDFIYGNPYHIYIIQVIQYTSHTIFYLRCHY